jgi:1-acyl-sn-glycerol-3-phosphate acyltransferase
MFLLIMISIGLVVMVICSPLLLLPRYKRYKYADIMFMTPWGNFMNKILLMMRIKVIGKEFVDRKRPTLYICNHQSWIDIALFIINSHCPAISKKEVKYIPLLGIFTIYAGTVFIDRTKTSSRFSIIKDVSDLLHNGTSLCLFPEGTRSISGDLLTPNLALLKLCFKQKITVVPAAIDGTRFVLAKHVHYFKPGRKVILKYTPPVNPVNFENAEDFAKACWNEVVKAHSEIIV